MSDNISEATAITSPFVLQTISYVIYTFKIVVVAPSLHIRNSYLPAKYPSQ